MSQANRPPLVALVTTLIAILGLQVASAEPLFRLGDDGRTFLYRARPGENPGLVAEMFGIPSTQVPAFLAANGISDPTRVGTGFTYRIPNPAAEALAQRNAALTQENARLAQSARDAQSQTDALRRAADEARAAAAEAERRSARLERLDRLWPVAKALVAVLLLLAVGASATAVAAVRRQAHVDRHARALGRDLEEKRKAALAERQESAKRILDLEGRVRALESQLGPRVLISGRGGG